MSAIIMPDSDLSFPPGFGPGVLPRETRFGECCDPFEKSGADIIPQEQWAGEIGKITLRKHVQKVKRQPNNSCASSSAVGGLEITEVAANLPWVELNQLFPYHWSSGGRDQGSSLDSNLQVLREKGCPPVSVWPESKGHYATPIAEAMKAALDHRIVEFFDVANWTEFGSALLQGFFVHFGYPGHAIGGVELSSMTQADYLNTWGKDWGNGGFGTISSRNIQWSYGVFAYRTAVHRGGD